MRVKFRTLAAGPSGVFHADSEHDLPADAAEALIAGGHAVAVIRIVPVAPAAVAVVTPPDAETAALNPVGVRVAKPKIPKAGK